MSRSGYSDDCSGWKLIKWRGAVASALRGQRGDAFLHEMLEALDALPVKELCSDALIYAVTRPVSTIYPTPDIFSARQTPISGSAAIKARMHQ